MSPAIWQLYQLTVCGRVAAPPVMLSDRPGASHLRSNEPIDQCRLASS